VKSSTKSALAMGMSAAALATFAVLAPKVASAATQCDFQQAFACGTYCSQTFGYNYSCCAVDSGASNCACFDSPVDCSPFFS